MRLSIVPLAAALLPLIASASAADDSEDYARNFTISNGQIYTPGLAIFNAPQPGTPMGGDTLHISLDVTTNGKMPLPPYADDSASAIFNITVFLSSYHTGRNFTIGNGTAVGNNYTSGDIMTQEPGSTVKHINWVWPDCLVGDGVPKDDDSDRGLYNISIRQNFRLNNEDHYTIFDVPILVTNSIPKSEARAPCDALDNPLLSPEELDLASANAIGIPMAPGDATEIEVKAKYPEGDDDDDEFGRFDEDKKPGDGSGAAGRAGGVLGGAAAMGVAGVAVALML